jgi:hypothetical protein
MGISVLLSQASSLWLSCSSLLAASVSLTGLVVVLVWSIPSADAAVSVLLTTKISVLVAMPVLVSTSSVTAVDPSELEVVPALF